MMREYAISPIRTSFQIARNRQTQDASWHNSANALGSEIGYIWT